MQYRLLLILSCCAVLYFGHVPVVCAQDASSKEVEQLDFAHGLFGRGLYPMAVTEYQKFITTYPQSPQVSEAFFSVAESYFFDAQYDKAIDQYKQYIEKFPEGSKKNISHVRIGQSYFHKKDYDQSISVLNTISSDSLSAENRHLPSFYIGKSYAQKEDWEAAKKAFKQASESADNNKYRVLTAIELAEIYAREKDYKQAFEYYKQIYKLSDDNSAKTAARYKQGEMSLLDNDPAQAAYIFEDIVTNYSTQEIAVDALNALLLSYFRLKEYDKVLKSYNAHLALLSSKQAQTEALYVVSSSYLQKEKYKEALIEIDKSMEIADDQPSQQKALLKKAEILFKSGEFDEALKFIQDKKLDQIEEQKDHLLLLKAEAKYELGDYKKAFGFYQQIVQEFPDSSVYDTALFGRAHAQNASKNKTEARQLFFEYFEKGQDPLQKQEALYNYILLAKDAQDYDVAIEGALKYLEVFSDQASREKMLFLLGNLYSDAGQFQKGVETFKEFINKFPQSVKMQEVYFLIGYNAQLAEQPDEALSFYQKVEANKNVKLYYSALKNTGLIYLSQGKDDQATQVFNSMIRNFSENDLETDTYLWLAEKNLDNKKYDDTITVLENVRVDKEDTVSQQAVHYFRAVAYREKNQCAEALKEYDSVLGIKERSTYTGAAYIGRAMCLSMQDNFDAAQKELEKVIVEFSDDTTLAMRARFELARAYERAKNLEEATKYYMLVAVLYSDDFYCPESLYRAGQIFEQTDKKTDAKKVYQELIELYPESIQLPKAQERIAALNEKS